MDPKQQASFIPKKPLTESSHDKIGGSLLGSISVFIFVLSILASLGFFGYNYLLKNRIKEMSLELEEARRSLQSERIAELARIDSRIENAKIILGKHVAVSGIFNALEALTVGSLRLTSLQFGDSKKEQVGSLDLRMEGVGRTFNSVALQSDIFGRERVFKNPIFSNLALDKNGNIEFEVSMAIDPELISYRNSIERDDEPIVDDQGEASSTPSVSTDDESGQ